MDGLGDGRWLGGCWVDGLGVKIVGGWLKDGCIDGIDRWFVFGLLDGWMLD